MLSGWLQRCIADTKSPEIAKSELKSLVEALIVNLLTYCELTTAKGCVTPHNWSKVKPQVKMFGKRVAELSKAKISEGERV